MISIFFSLNWFFFASIGNDIWTKDEYLGLVKSMAPTRRYYLLLYHWPYSCSLISVFCRIPKFVINGTILILTYSISVFWMAMSPGVQHKGYTYLNLLDSPELLQMLVTLTTVIKPLKPNFLGNYRYFKLRKAFSKFYRRHSALVEKYSVSLKTLLQQGISEPEFCGDLVYRFRKKKCRKI